MENGRTGSIMPFLPAINSLRSSFLFDCNHRLKLAILKGRDDPDVKSGSSENEFTLKRYLRLTNGCIGHSVVSSAERTCIPTSIGKMPHGRDDPDVKSALFDFFYEAQLLWSAGLQHRFQTICVTLLEYVRSICYINDSASLIKKRRQAAALQRDFVSNIIKNSNSRNYFSPDMTFIFLNWVGMCSRSTELTIQESHIRDMPYSQNLTASISKMEAINQT